MSAAPRAFSPPGIGAVVAGNALEFYSFLIFSTFASQIGAAYFPGGDPTDSLLLTLATYGVGFLARPLGGVVIGTLGDTWGRRPTTVLSLVLMGVSVAGMALTPSAAHIGAAAPVLVVLFRLLQGFALGGGVGPVTAVLLEAAPPDRRSLQVAQQSVGQYAASMSAAVMGFALTTLLSPEALAGWGWRAALLAGLAVLPAAMVIRRALPETLCEAPDSDHSTASLLRLGLLGLCMVAGAAIASYTINYLGSFIIHTLHRPPALALGASLAAGTCGIAGALVGGYLGDRLGRKPVMIGGSLALLALVLPCFMMMAWMPSPAWLVLAPGVMGFFLGLYIPPVLTSLAESLPISLRAGSLGIIYALAASSFGGTAQFAISWLIAVTGSPLAPAWYMAGGLALGLGAMFLMGESAPGLERGQGAFVPAAQQNPLQ